MPFPSDGVEVGVSAIQEQLHESFFVVPDEPHHPVGVGLGEGVQTLYGYTVVQEVAVGVIPGLYLEAEGSKLQEQRAGRVSAAAHTSSLFVRVPGARSGAIRARAA